MSHSNNRCRTAKLDRLLTVDGLLRARGVLLISLVPVLLITNGGAG